MLYRNIVFVIILSIGSIGLYAAGNGNNSCNANDVAGTYLRLLTDPTSESNGISQDEITLHADGTVWANQAGVIVAIQTGTFVPSIGSWTCGPNKTVLATYVNYQIRNAIDPTLTSNDDAQIRTDQFAFNKSDLNHPMLINRAVVDFCGLSSNTAAENALICANYGSTYTVGFIPTTNLLNPDPVHGIGFVLTSNVTTPRPYERLQPVNLIPFNNP
jgi:hypothetical protein